VSNALTNTRLCKKKMRSKTHRQYRGVPPRTEHTLKFIPTKTFGYNRSRDPKRNGKPLQTSILDLFCIDRCPGGRRDSPQKRKPSGDTQKIATTQQICRRNSLSSALSLGPPLRSVPISLGIRMPRGPQRRKASRRRDRETPSDRQDREGELTT